MSVQACLEMQMRGGGAAGGPDQSDHVPSGYGRSGLDPFDDLRQVRVVGLIAATVIENDQVAEPAAPSHKRDLGVAHRMHVGPLRRSHIDAQMVAGNLN